MEEEVPLNPRDGGNAKGKGSLRTVLVSTFFAACGSVVFGSSVSFSSPAQAAIMHDMGISLSQYSIFGSILTIGAMIGALASGWTADFVGRKKAMQISCLFCAVGWIGILFAKDVMMLYSARFLSGCGIGLSSYVVPVFVAEIARKDVRGGLTTLNQLFICSGGALVLVAGSFVAWRTLALVGLVPCVISFVGLFFVPESPRWLAKVHMTNEFHDALQKLRGREVDIVHEAEEIQDCIESLNRFRKAKFQDLFQHPHLRSVIISVGLMFFQQLGGMNGVGFYGTRIFHDAGFSEKMGNVLLGASQIPMSLIGAFLMDRSGRRHLLVWSLCGLITGCLLMGIAFCMQEHGFMLDLVPALAFVGIMIYTCLMSIGMGAVPWVIMSEIFPIDIKAMAGSLTTLVNWIGSFGISYAFNFLMSWSSSGTFFIFAAVNATGMLFVLLMVPETKDRSLEEIQKSLIK